MVNTKTIGSKIAEARKKINLSQAQLAERLFISAQAVGKWERGESMPDITTFYSLAEILGVDLNYFSETLQSVPPETASSPPRWRASEPLVKPSSEGSPWPGKAGMPVDKAGKKSGWDMSGGNWEDTDFSGLKNLHEKFSSSNIQRCLFIGSDLSGLLLKGNHVVGCDFSASDLSSSRLQGTYLVKSLLKDCLLKEAELSQCHVQGCDFTGAVFKSSNFWKNNMSNVVLKQTSFTGTDLNDLLFDGSIEDCSFENCSFKNVTFERCTLLNTGLKNTGLKKIRFVDCQVDKLTYAFLKSGKADLTDVTLID